jgi:hypothetical protein
MNHTIITFGEIPGSPSPEGLQLFVQSMPATLEFPFPRAEANVAASLAVFGAKI